MSMIFYWIKRIFPSNFFDNKMFTNYLDMIGILYQERLLIGYLIKFQGNLNLGIMKKWDLKIFCVISQMDCIKEILKVLFRQRHLLGLYLLVEGLYN